MSSTQGGRVGTKEMYWYQQEDHYEEVGNKPDKNPRQEKGKFETKKENMCTTFPNTLIQYYVP